MNPPNPFIPQNSGQNQKPEEKFRGLIIAGNVIGIVIMIAIIIVAGYTIRQSALHRTMDMMDQVVAAMDTAAVDVAVSSDYSNWNAEYQEQLNDEEALKLRMLIPDTASNRDKIINSLSLIQTRTDEICLEIRKLTSEFSDSSANAYSYNEDEVTSHFFITAGRGAVLLMQLQDYRNDVITAVTEVDNAGNVYGLKDALPLDDTPSNGYTVTWDTGKLQGACADAIEYLKSMETEVRNFESSAFNRIPRTVVQ